MLSHRELVLALRNLGVDGSHPVIAHASLSAFGAIEGGADAVVGALLEHFETLVMPTFTYNTMIIPEDGPPNNAIEYGTMKDRNKMAEFFYNDMPADKLMGVIAETLRQHSQARRSGHPILSFCGVNADDIIEAQTLSAPLAPIASLADQDGWVLLLGVNHKSNTSIHLGERLAGRKTFTRWALMPDIIVECPKFPSCSDGFNAIQPLMEPFTYKARVGDALVQAMPLPELIETTRQLVQADPLALLCERPECLRCNAVRDDVKRLKAA
jgi:aminoglycoside 3-N-acetyltransferase